MQCGQALEMLGKRGREPIVRLVCGCPNGVPSNLGQRVDLQYGEIRRHGFKGDAVGKALESSERKKEQREEWSLTPNAIHAKQIETHDQICAPFLYTN